MVDSRMYIFLTLNLTVILYKVTFFLLLWLFLLVFFKETDAKTSKVKLHFHKRREVKVWRRKRCMRKVWKSSRGEVVCAGISPCAGWIIKPVAAHNPRAAPG